MIVALESRGTRLRKADGLNLVIGDGESVSARACVNLAPSAREGVAVLRECENDIPVIRSDAVVVDIYGDIVGRHSCGYDEFAHPLRRAVHVEGDKIRVTAGVAGGYLEHQGQAG